MVVKTLHLTAIGLGGGYKFQLVEAGGRKEEREREEGGVEFYILGNPQPLQASL